MASAQCDKPANQTSQQIQSAGHEKAVHQGGCQQHQEDNEHGFGAKVKEMVETARKKITEHMKKKKSGKTDKCNDSSSDSSSESEDECCGKKMN